MFDFAWSEIALIGAVALIAIGPKDLPVAIKAVTGAIKKARKMASEFQTHVDELVREADLGEVKKNFSELRNFDLRSTVAAAVDPDHSIRDTLATNPLASSTGTTAATVDADAAALPEPVAEPEVVEPPGVPAFIPPEFVPPAAATPASEAAASGAAAAAVAEPDYPAFIPPAFAHAQQRRA